MRKIKEILNTLKILNKKKLLGYCILILIVGIMSWAFISAGLITANFNRTQIQGTQNEQKVDAVGIIITETKDGKKYFEIYLPEPKTVCFFSERPCPTKTAVPAKTVSEISPGQSRQELPWKL